MSIIQKDGYIRIVDRKKDMINVSGFKVFPNEVEDVLASHPDILEAAVVGVPDAEGSEVVKAYVVTSRSMTVEEVREIGRASCRERVYIAEGVGCTRHEKKQA